MARHVNAVLVLSVHTRSTRGWTFSFILEETLGLKTYAVLGPGSRRIKCFSPGVVHTPIELIGLQARITAPTCGERSALGPSDPKEVL